ncbi:bifunctional 2-C-methyl-D-erythritol 4-phosphate cytidylyltransferase/2-C-methyl-D-erythritol 2,4-cyclodiphosphate synthase [Maricaulaceae bacterium MS644]
MSKLGFSALIVAAGRGERAGGGVPKQLRTLAGKPVLAWSVERFKTHPDCREIIIAIAPGEQDAIKTALGPLSGAVRLVEGGASRTASVRAALAAAGEDRVMIHDAARPLLTARILDDLAAALDDAEGAAPALALSDALVRDGEAGVEAVDRTGLWRMQTPQAFQTAPLRAAFSKAGETDFPDEVSLARAAAIEVVLVPGDEANFKITWPDDFARAEAQLRADGATPAAAVTVSGLGYDVHRLAPGDGVHLCGVFIACNLHLIGHSDADAGLHAITDALLGAAGLGDIGDHFPPTDERWRGADSAMFLRHAVGIAAEAGASPVHCDVTLICERPKIGPHKAAMKARVAELLQLAPARVNIKATTTEQLGFTGRGEGLAAEAVVTVRI